MSKSGNPNYAGDLAPTDAWELLKSDRNARLIDVRTAPEWSFVGLPDLQSLGRTAMCVAWQNFPSMQVNPDFVDDVIAELGGIARNVPLLFICRSGARSRAAAIAMTGAGFSRAYNVAGGFEGDLDSERHRGRQNGWKASGLPWKQT